MKTALVSQASMVLLSILPFQFWGERGMHYDATEPFLIVGGFGLVG